MQLIIAFSVHLEDLEGVETLRTELHKVDA